MPLARLRGARLPLLRDETACRWAGGAEKQHCYQESRSWAAARSIVENRSLPRRGRRCGSSGLGAGSLWTGRKVPGEGVLSSENRNTQGCREPYKNLFGLQLLQNHLHFQGIWISDRGILFLISIFLPMLGPEFVVQKGRSRSKSYGPNSRLIGRK